MAEIQQQYQDWASRKAGQGAAPEGEMPAGESTEEIATDEELPPPAECIRHAAMELGEACDYLEKAKGQVEDPDAIDEMIEDLKKKAEELNAKADEIDGGEAEEKGEEEDGQEEETTPEPEAV